MDSGGAFGPPEKPKLAGKRVLMVEDEPLVRSTSLPHSKAPALTWDRREPKKKRYTFDTTLLDAALLDANLCGHPVDEIAAALGACNVHFYS